MNQAFIDGQNLRYSTAKTEDHPWNIDLQRFRVYLTQKYKVDQAYYFLGYESEENQQLYTDLENAGFIVIFRRQVESLKTTKKGNVDSDIIFEIMRKLADQEKFGKVVLVSGDGDYFKMVNYLIQKKKFYRLLAPNERHMSTLYKTLPPKYYAFLDRPGVKNKIAYRPNRNNKNNKKRKQKTGSA